MNDLAYITPLSPISSYESCSSSFGDIHTGPCFQRREDGSGALDVSQKKRDFSNESFHAKNSEDGSRHHMSTEKNLSSSSLDSTDAGNKLINDILDDAQSKNVAPGLCNGEAHIENDVLLLLPDFESDPKIWYPPEPENMEDDKPSIADNYEDDDYSNTDWKQPSSLCSLDEHQGINHRYREKRQRAMLEAMNGQFKILVSRFLTSEGIDISILDDGQSWVDIVASLSWEAAFRVKPDATEGRAMDPGSYVKVKCIASGSRQQSELIKGLVFKKNAAHKHMPTKFKKPKLLLLQGILGHSAVGLSSFDSMEQEEDYVKSITEMIEGCRPNVVLVEKNISRDVQESLIEKDKEMTMVSDMKLHRLQRISLCTGSPIISCSDFPAKLILPQCNSFHIERFIEEHNNPNEAGKRPSKTLMFLEGFQKPLGCTILLKGAESDELKKVKRVVQYTVFAAYHLILETSFFADQRVFFTDNTALIGGNLDGSESSPSTMAPENVDVPICSGSFGRFNHSKAPLNSNLHCTLSDKSDNVDMSMLNSSESYQSQELLSPFFASHENFEGDNLPTLGLSSTDFAHNNTFAGQSGLHASLGDHEISANCRITEEKLDDGILTKIGSVGDSNEGIDDDACNNVKRKHRDDIESVLDPQSILVLLSKQCMTKGTICEQSHLSRIKYYGYFDISLGRYLKEILHNQNSCSSCGEAPEAHVYCYTHQNGNLSVRVTHLPSELHLPGEAEGKIWMWTRCLRCKNGNDMPTRRVVLSSSARSLSFGKFLELSFSGHSAANRLSECGHSLHRDFLRFFGLGSKVALFVYSSVKIYNACKPPPVLEFHDPKGQEWLKREIEQVLFRGRSIFSEVSDMLQKLKPRYSGALANTKLSGSLKDFAQVEDMLIEEKAEFEASLSKAIDQSGQMEIARHEVGLKWLNQELLLELYIWDRRLDCLLQHIKFQQEKDAHVVDEEVPIIQSHEDEQPCSNASCQSHPMQIDLVIESTEPPNELQKSTGLLSDRLGSKEYASSVLERIPQRPGDLLSSCVDNHSDQEAYLPISEDIEIHHSVQIVKEPCINKTIDAELKTDEEVGASLSNENSSILNDIYAKSEGPEDMIWASFSDLRREYRKDLCGGSLQKFEFVNGYNPIHLSPMYQPSCDEMDLLHFSVGPGGNVLSASKDEISSIIACALAISEDKRGLLERVESEPGEIHKSYSLTSDGSGISAYWSSTGSSESEGINMLNGISSFSSDEPSTSISDGLLSVDLVLASSDNLHPEVAVGTEKFSGKSLYSVVCVYARQFYKLRKQCCPSELAYISSLSRCKKWDAQGGKSRAFFAKSLDDRFIIKQIKKTELDSFLKFGPDYFKHVFHSLDLGSQTCLAKILGIYQVRQNRSGIKTDLMVMENLLYGHKISRIYDLKGTVFARYIQDAKYGDKVLLDQNFVEDMQKSPIYLGGKTKHLLQRAIWNDTSFLTSINVMDYSLLVGVDDERRELVFGIIDYLRQYTWDKQLETWVKSSMVVPRNELPTVISPKEYKKRFRKFMARHFLAVPHSWNCEHCLPSCIFCVDGKRNSAKVHNAELSEQS